MLGINRRQIPPLQQLYCEMMGALNQRDGPLGKKFAKASRDLVDELYTRTTATAAIMGSDGRMVDVPRDANYGIPMVAFIDHDREE
ncbi:hypothetical protein H9P43_006248 [Blastocladiella emersonii ATCC 22665]|nr:hypothetical protein H9P43_006248 [Blastocladiella emersonii ATCC 22665]